jgi:hypothetical protein
MCYPTQQGSSFKTTDINEKATFGAFFNLFKG